MTEPNKSNELSDKELNGVSGGTIVDTVVSVAQNAWKVLTSSPVDMGGVKGESLDDKHRD
jgi:bacteriocin-like protein